LIISFAVGSFVFIFKGLAVKMLEKGIRVNCVAPGPVWTPLIVSSYPKDEMNQFGSDVSLEEITCQSSMRKIEMIFLPKKENWSPWSSENIKSIYAILFLFSLQ
jgi:NAD(P)-dependent dehydrogenase (short-subunit alcohol dehydrogenase family)